MQDQQTQMVKGKLDIDVVISVNIHLQILPVSVITDN